MIRKYLAILGLLVGSMSVSFADDTFENYDMDMLQDNAVEVTAVYKCLARTRTSSLGNRGVPNYGRRVYAGYGETVEEAASAALRTCKSTGPAHWRRGCRLVKNSCRAE